VKNFQPSPESLEKIFATPPQSLATLMALISQGEQIRRVNNAD
jgi:hypothetical protein